MEDQPRFLTVPEAARLLRINRGRAYEMAANGALPGVIRLGRTIRVDRERLIAGLVEDQQSSHVRRVAREPNLHRSRRVRESEQLLQRSRQERKYE